jgi:hypothetical protein
MMPRQGQPHAANMRGDLSQTIESVRVVYGIDRGFHLYPSRCQKVPVQTATGSGAIDQKLRERRLVIRKSARGALTCRMARRRTCTTKLLNSNSFIGTNSRLGSSEELAKNFIIVFKLRSSLTSNLDVG